MNTRIELSVKNPYFIGQISKQAINAVHKRDQFVCYFCGLRSTKYQQVVNLNNNWRDLNTIVTACIFCQQCFFLDSMIQMRSGIPIFFPQIDQTDINLLAVELHIAKMYSERSKQIQDCLDLLISTKDNLEISTLTELTSILREGGTEKDHSLLDSKIFGLRLFPLDRRIIKEGEIEFDQFPQILSFWHSVHGLYPSNRKIRFKRLDEFADNYL